MTVYDFTSGFNSFGSGLDALSASLRDAQKQQTLSDLSSAFNSGNYDQAAADAVRLGDLNTGFQLKQYAIQQKQPALTLDDFGSSGASPPQPSASSAQPNSSAATAGAAAPSGNQPIAPQLQSGISAANKALNLDPSYLPVTARIESAGGYNTGSGSKYKGPFQFDGPTAASVGLQDPNDPAQAAMGAGNLALSNSSSLKARIGRDPTPAETYLAHQQGAGGAAALINADPGTSAASIIGYNAVAGNLPSSMRDQASTMSAQDFARFQTGRWNAVAKSMGFTPGQTVVASAAPTAAGQSGYLTPQEQAAINSQVTPQARAIAAANPPPARPGPVQVASLAPNVPSPDNSTPTPQPPSDQQQLSALMFNGSPQGGQAPSTFQQGPILQGGLPAPIASPSGVTSAPPGARGPAIAVAGYSGQFTRAQAQAQDALEAAAGDDDNLPDVPNTKEWDAAAAKAGAPVIAQPPPTVSGALPAANSPQAVPQQQPPVAPPGVNQQALNGFFGRMQAAGDPGSLGRIRFLMNAQAQAANAALINPRAKVIADQIGGMLKNEQDLASKLAAPTNDQQNYAFYRQQELAAGRQPVSFQDWVSKDKTPQGQVNLQYAMTNWQKLGLPDPSTIGDDPGAKQQWAAMAQKALGLSSQPLVENKVDLKGEGAEAAESGKLAATRRGDLLAAADKAPDNIARLQLLGNVLDATKTGQFAGALATVGGYAAAIGMSPDALKGLGIDPNQATNADIAGKLASELVMGSIGAKNGGFPASNFSVAERQFIEKTFPSIQNQPGANQAVTDVLIAREQRILQKADEWANYKDAQRAGGKTASFEDFEDQFRRAHANDNIFAPIIQKFQSGGYGPTGAQSPQTLPNTNSKAAPGQLRKFDSPSDPGFAALKPGDHFLDAQGNERIVPGAQQ